MFESIIKTATFRQSQVTILGTIINGALGALFYILLARLLGPSDFGILFISLSTLVLVADMADIGTNTGLVRFVSANLLSDRDKAYRFLKLSLEVKIFAWFIVLLVFFAFSPILATVIFHKPELAAFLQLAAFGVGGALLFSFATSALQAYQKYFLWSVLNIGTNLLRLILIIVFSSFLILSAENSLMIYIAMPFFGFFIALFLIPTRKILKSRMEGDLSKEFFRYNIPVAIFTIISAFSSKLDTFLNASLLSTKDVGVYGIASQLVQIMPQVIAGLGLVAGPKFASFSSNDQMVAYLKKFQLLVAGLVVVGIVILPLVIYFIPIVIGQDYKEAVLPFIFLFIAMLVFLFSVPVHNSVIFYFGRPDVFIWISIGHLSIIGVLGYLMISNFGVVGASLTVLSGTIFNFLYPLIWLLNRLRNKKLAK